MSTNIRYQTPRNHPQGSTLANRTMRKQKVSKPSGKPAPEPNSWNVHPATLRSGHPSAIFPATQPDAANIAGSGVSSQVMPTRKPLPSVPGHIGNVELATANSSGRTLAAAAGRAAISAAAERDTVSAKQQRPALSVRTDFGAPRTDHVTCKYVKAGTLRAGQTDALAAAWGKLKAGGNQEERARAKKAAIAEQRLAEAAQKYARSPSNYESAQFPGPLDSASSSVVDGASRPESAASSDSKSSFSNWIRKTTSRRGSNASLDSTSSASSIKSTTSSIAGSAKKLWGYFRDLDAKDEEARREKRRKNLKAAISHPAPDDATIEAAQRYGDVRAQLAKRTAPRSRTQVLDNGWRGTTIGDLMHHKPQPDIVVGRAPVLSTYISVDEAVLAKPTDREILGRHRERPIVASQSESRKGSDHDEHELAPKPSFRRAVSSIYSAHPGLGRQASYSSVSGNPYLESVRDSHYGEW